jgi:tetratricopeptide (TPR) repeat protein
MRPRRKQNDHHDLVRRGIVAHRAGDLNKASLLYAQVLKSEPSHPEALHLLGLIRKANGERKAFYEMTDKALQISPAYAPAWSNLAKRA